MNKVKLGLIVLITAAFIGSGHLAYAQNAPKIGYLDLSRVFDEYSKTKTYDAQLETQHKAFEDERNKKIDVIREKQGKLGLVKEAEKAKMQEELDKLRAELLEFDRQKKTELTKQRDERIREILLEIEKVVKDYAEKEKYSFILNDRVLVFGDPTLNVTEPIIKLMNEKK